jgi:hypothetical protein
MNLKDIDVEVFKRQIDEEVKRRLTNFESELKYRADALKVAAEDITKASTEGVFNLLSQISDPRSLVFTSTIPMPDGWLSSGGERPVRLNFGSGDYLLGDVQDITQFFGARVILTVIPAKGSKP